MDADPERCGAEEKLGARRSEIEVGRPEQETGSRMQESGFRSPETEVLGFVS